jgi:hypothetical protein
LALIKPHAQRVQNVLVVVNHNDHPRHGDGAVDARVRR